MKFYLKLHDGRFILDYGQRVNGDTVVDPCRIPFLCQHKSRLLTNSFVFEVPLVLKDRKRADTMVYVYEYYKLFNELYQSFDYISVRCLEKTLGLYERYLSKYYRSSIFIHWGSGACVDLEYGVPMLLLMLQIESISRSDPFSRRIPILKYYMGFLKDKRSKKQRVINHDIGDMLSDKPILFPTRRVSLEKKMPDVDSKKIGCVTFVPIRIAHQNSKRDPAELLRRSVQTHRYGLGISKLDAFSVNITPPFYDFGKNPKSLLYPGTLLYPDKEPSIHVPPVLSRSVKVAN
jgi:hypothetical protein